MERLTRTGFYFFLLYIFLASASTLLSLRALAQESETVVGRVILVTGNVNALPASGANRILQRGSEVYEYDTVVTGPTAYIQIRLADGGLLALQPGSEFAFREFRYDGPEGAGDSAVFSLLKGGFRTMSGSIGEAAADHFSIETGYAHIGIRGTSHEAYIDAASDSLLTGVSDGGTIVSNVQGSLDLGLGADFDFSQTFAGQAPRGLLTMPAQLGAFIPLVLAEADAGAGGGQPGVQDAAEEPAAGAPAPAPAAAIAAAPAPAATPLAQAASTQPAAAVPESNQSQARDLNRGGAALASADPGAAAPPAVTGRANDTPSPLPSPAETGTGEGVLALAANGGPRAPNGERPLSSSATGAAAGVANGNAGQGGGPAPRPQSGLPEATLNATGPSIAETASIPAPSTPPGLARQQQEDAPFPAPGLAARGEGNDPSQVLAKATGQNPDHRINPNQNSLDILDRAGGRKDDRKADHKNKEDEERDNERGKGNADNGSGTGAPALPLAGNDETELTPLGRRPEPAMLLESGPVGVSLGSGGGKTPSDGAGEPAPGIAVTWGYWNESGGPAAASATGAPAGEEALHYQARLMPADMEALRSLSATWHFATPAGSEHFIGRSDSGPIEALDMRFDVDLSSGRISNGGFRALAPGQEWNLGFSGQVQGAAARLDLHPGGSLDAGGQSSPVAGDLGGAFTGSSAADAGFAAGFSLHAAPGATLQGLGVLKGETP